MKYIIAVIAVLFSCTAQADDAYCESLGSMKVHFSKVFPDAEQIVLDKERTRAYLKRFNLLGDFTRYHGDAMLLNVLRSGSVLVYIVQGDGSNCLRVQIAGHIHQQILALMNPEGSPI